MESISYTAENTSEVRYLPEAKIVIVDRGRKNFRYLIASAGKKAEQLSKKLADELVLRMKQIIRSGGQVEGLSIQWDPLSDITVFLRGESTTGDRGEVQPLIRTGRLIDKSIKAEQVSSTQWIVTVRHPAAGVHEFGCIYRVTPKMRAWLASRGVHLYSTTNYIHVPARPFMNPAVELIERELATLGKKELGREGWPLPVRLEAARLTRLM